MIKGGNLVYIYIYSKVLRPFRIRKDSFIPFFTEHLFFVATGTNFTQRFVF